jgi:hypothetical protein
MEEDHARNLAALRQHRTARPIALEFSTLDEARTAFDRAAPDQATARIFRPQVKSAERNFENDDRAFRR